MSPDAGDEGLRALVLDALERVVDPCSVAAGAAAGLVSMGLVGDVAIDDGEGGAQVSVTLRITAPTCLMGAVFETTAAREIGALPGVAGVAVVIDRAYIWDKADMTPAYRRRLADYRAAQMRAAAVQWGGAVSNDAHAVA